MRSFVLRKGRITQAQQTALDTLLPKYRIAPGEKITAGDAGFSSSAPLWLEIGFGNGDMLLNLASAMPDINFIGAEVHPPGVGRLLLNVDKEALRNVRVVDRDAVQFIEEQVADGALDRVLLFFPDPWHKKRHHKRRIVNEAFAGLLSRKLSPGGVFHAATDWQEYAEHMLEVLDAHPKLENSAGRGSYSPTPDYRIQTRFEHRGRALGHGVWDLIYRRIADE